VVAAASPARPSSSSSCSARVRSRSSRAATSTARGWSPRAWPGGSSSSRRPSHRCPCPAGARAAWRSGLAALTAWTGASLAWTQATSVALDYLQRAVLYLGALVAAVAFLRPREAARLAEPLLVLGAVAAIGYGLSERLLPTLVDLSGSASAGGRLELPLTYWNAEGALAALGWVLAARLAGEATRAPWLRCAGAAAAAVLGLGVYLSFSRGALLAAGIGLLALLWLARSRGQARSLASAVGAGLLLAAVVSSLESVRLLDAARGADPAEGLLLLVVLALVAGGAAAVQLWLTRAEGGRDDELGLPQIPARLLVPALLVAAAAGLALVATLESSPAEPEAGAGASRLGSVQSNRYAYWSVAAGMWAGAPLTGEGAGTFRVTWLEEREIDDVARDAHSLYLETAAELGLPGLLALALLLGGTGLAGQRALRADRALAAGPAAAALAWAVHAGLDWDWEMPALTLVAVVCGGLLIAAADEPEGRRRH